MGKYYKRIFWGYLVIILDINLSMSGTNIDFLPDFIGYIMIGTALANLAQNEEIFRKGVKASYALAVVEILNILTTKNIGTVYTFIITSIESILWLFIIYSICKGIEKEGIKYNKGYISTKATSIWDLEFIRFTIGVAYSAILLNYNEGVILGTIGILLIALTICIVIMLLKLLNSVGGQLNEVN